MNYSLVILSNLKDIACYYLLICTCYFTILLGISIVCDEKVSLVKKFYENKLLLISIIVSLSIYLFIPSTNTFQELNRLQKENDKLHEEIMSIKVDLSECKIKNSVFEL